jgi:hypothetical protein
MRVKLRESISRSGFTSESYMVIYYALGMDNQIMYGFFNDDLMVCNMLESSLIIVDNDKEDLIQKDNLNYNRTFFINKLLYEIFDLKDSYVQIQTHVIWYRAKLYLFFKAYNFRLTEHYLATALNEQYKLNLIEGFLLFANQYIVGKFEGGHYFEKLDFYKANTFQSWVEVNSESELVILDKTNYKQLILDLISDTLYQDEIGEEKSVGYVTDLFMLIDSIFIEPIDDIYKFETHYDNCLVIKYKEELYYLNKNWYG